MSELNKETKEGVIVFLKVNETSKSEAILPFLYVDANTIPISVLLENDNPFENKGLLSFDGKKVILTGITAPSGTFIINEIKELY